MTFRGGLEHIIEQQVAAIRDQVRAALEELAKQRVEGESSDGLARAIVLGTGDVVEVRVNPDRFRQEHIAEVERAVAQAVNAAQMKARKLRQERLGEMAGGMMGFLGEDLLGAL